MQTRRRLLIALTVMGFGAGSVIAACSGDSTVPDGGGVDATSDTISPKDASSKDGEGGTVVDSGGCPDAGQTLCGSTCVDTQNDPLNCGACSKKCSTTDAGTFACISGKCGDAIIDVALGNHHACVALADGEVWCWGDNGRGQLGVARTTGTSSTPVKANIDSVVRIVAGFDTTCAVKNDNTVWCWGLNQNGSLGHASGGGSPTDDNNCTTNCNATPQKVGGLPAADQVFIMQAAACARTVAGGVYCWGTQFCGNLGVPDAGGTNLIPSPVANVSGIAQLMGVGDSPNAECAIQDAGALTCWGDNWFGQCGHTPEATPPACSGFGGIALPSTVSGISNVTSVASSFNDFVCATSSAGQAFCWGSDITGTVTPPTIDGSAAFITPTQIALGTTAAATKVVTGDSHACALLNDGTVRCWGIDAAGQFGNGVVGDAGAVAATAVSSVTNAANVYSGSVFSGALLKDGSLVLWGGNVSGELAHAPGTAGDVACAAGHCNATPSVVSGLP